MQTLVSIVVLSHARPDHLRKALASIARQTYPEIEVIVVDNRSSRTAEIQSVLKDFPSFRTLWLSENHGFTGGMNRGIELASGEYVYLTEDDMALAEDCVDRFLEYARQSPPSVALLSPVVIGRGTGRVRFAGGAVLLGPAHQRLDFHTGGVPSALPDRPYPVSFASGAAMWASRETWMRLQGFQDDFFMYYEDVELCLRLLIDGYEIHVLPNAHVFDLDDTPDRRGRASIEYHKLKNLFSIYLVFAPLAVIPEFLFRYAVLGFFRSFGSRQTWATMKAVLRTIVRLPKPIAVRSSYSNDQIRETERKPSSCREFIRAANEQSSGFRNFDSLS
jgi:GT2 family glycosyltransferase